ncbi:MAG: L-serine ammonia-lyase, iron-sulfur-dependent, subunit alpha [Eggerthellaceae bacterium]|nr:L-serine ammonia-lyase, iron-sulfur-dependent, subunit alpha [Eggerthellaceae bacterium]
MKQQRIADIIGPIMVGPSSSHTAGALRIASMARRLSAGTPARVEFKLYGSFAHTYHGHGTDRALVGGILGMEADDLRIRTSFELAREAGVEVAITPLPDAPYDHPNTVDVIMTDTTGATVTVRGISIGGGAAVLTQINGVDVSITGECASVIVRHRDTVGVLAHITQSVSLFGGNIATLKSYREKRGETAYTVLELDSMLSDVAREAILVHPHILDVRAIPADGPTEAASEPDDRAAQELETLDFPTGEALLAYCNDRQTTIAQAFRAREDAIGRAQGKPFDLDAYLARVFSVMKASATEPIEAPAKTMGGLIGGEAHAVAQLEKSGKGIATGQMAKVTRYAMAVLETNAAMGRIVAAPTAGSSGVLPAALLALSEEGSYTDEQIADALVTAAAVGCLITRNATVAGAEGGCQAEIGAAAAMAAAAAVELGGGSPAQCLAAASNAIANMLGLVCDPIAGLVEVPCQKRNASGAACALVSAQIALAGVENLVSFDESVDALYRVGRALPFELRESALGGLAAEPSACKWCESFMCASHADRIESALASE